MMTTSPSDIPGHLVREWAVVLWDNGYPISDICKALDRTLNTVRYHLKIEGRLHSYPHRGRPHANQYKTTRKHPPPSIPMVLRKRLKERCVSKPKPT